jgi:hypothetical protein
VILNVYRQKARLNNKNSNVFRGIPQTMYVWDELACGPKLIVEDNGAKHSNIRQNVRAKFALEKNGMSMLRMIVMALGWCMYIRKF